MDFHIGDPTLALCFEESEKISAPVFMQEDPWNSIAAGFLTGGFLQLRTGPRSAAQSAVFGGVLLVGNSALKSKSEQLPVEPGFQSKARKASV